MKKQKLLTLCCALLAGFHTHAQTAYAPAPEQAPEERLNRLRIGAVIAPGLAWMKPSAEKDGNQTQRSAGNELSFMYGLMFDYEFAGNYAISTGLQINSTGGIIETSNPSAAELWASKTHMNYSLQYIELPVAIKLKTDPINNFRIFGQAGLTVGFNIGKKATYEIVQKNSTLGDSVYKTDVKEKLTGGIGVVAPVMFQMNLGTGIQYAVSQNVDAYIGVFFNNGFAPNATDPTKNNKLPKFTDGNTRMNSFSLRLGFYF
ncbi:MAG: porin family protein [Chitinophagaceae bacterium]